MVSINIVLRITNPILGFFSYIKFLDIVNLEIFIDLILFISTTSILSTLLLLQLTHLIALLLLIDVILMKLPSLVVASGMVLSLFIITNLVKNSPLIIFNIEVSSTSI